MFFLFIRAQLPDTESKVIDKLIRDLKIPIVSHRSQFSSVHIFLKGLQSKTTIHVQSQYNHNPRIPGRTSDTAQCFNRGTLIRW